MKTYMLDTDVCSYLIRGQNRSLMEKVALNHHRLCISAITRAELLYGVARRKSRRLAADVELLLSLLPSREWNDGAAAAYAEIRANLEERGKTIGNMDIQIAAAAKSGGCCLVTNNVAHFGLIPGLDIENWAKQEI